MNQNQPPRWASLLLRWWSNPNTSEEVEGDLLELYTYWVETVGQRKANWRYAFNVIKLLRPFAKDKRSIYPTTYSYSPTMLTNYFKIAFRNLVKHKGYSFINVFGLATGMAVAMLIGLWIWDELSFNKYHQNYARIAQVMINETDQGKVGYSNVVQYPLATELKTNYQNNFKHIVTVSHVVEYILTAGEKKFTRKGQYMEAGAPEMLSLKMVYGNWSGLKDLHSILISVTTAQALFGTANPLNQIIKINNQLDLKVTGVYEDMPLNSEFSEIKFLAPFDLWVSDNAWVRESANNWSNHFLKVYAEIQPTTDFEQVSTTIKDAELNHIADFKEKVAKNPQVFLHPMSKWHLYPLKKGKVNAEPIQMLWLVGIIGMFVLILACINFVNLSTARSEKRAKEVGIRKAVGSKRGQLIGQFFSESFLVVVISFFLALFLVAFSLDRFNDLSAKLIVMPWENTSFWSLCFIFISITSLLAGAYPSFYLSSFQPIKVLKGISSVGHFASAPRKVLVVLQFTVSIALIISTTVVYRQIQYASDRPIGYNREGLITVPMNDPNYKGKLHIIKSELLNTGIITEIAMSSSPLTSVWNNNSDFSWSGKDPQKEANFACMNISDDFAKMVDWQFIAGRDFSKAFATDSSAVIINETAAKYLNLKNPIGEFITTNGGKHYLQIVGVIKDMIIDSPYEPVKKGIFFYDKNYSTASQIIIKIKPTVSAVKALSKIETVVKKIVPSAPFDYTFVDEDYNAKFKAEKRISKLATFFAILTIFISCLGLFGLASFVAEQRTKEIGIRKVLGASTANLWQLLSKDFVVLVVISCLIAAPIAYYFMNEWLQKYTYRTEISWWIFAASAVGALLITMLTVSFQAIKAALVNPVKSLKSE
jgi:ABC-type antimicrobial peptide transport system permease subunit